MVDMLNERERNWPLVVFLTLGPASVGCLLGGLVLGAGLSTGRDGVSAWLFAVAVATGALVVGGIAVLGSLAHLNKPLRAYRALRRFPHSPLSRETGLYAIYLALVGLYWLLLLLGLDPTMLAVVALAVGFPAIYASAQVYLIPARPSWYHWSTVLGFMSCALSLGGATSLSLSLAWPETMAGSGSAALVAKALVIIGVVGTAVALWRRVGYLRAATPDTQAAWRLIETDYCGQWRLRLLVGLGLPFVTVGLSFATEGFIVLAWLALLVGELLDRSLFFVSSTPLSVRVELVRALR